MIRSVITAYAQLWAGQENLPIDQFADASASCFKVEGDWAHVLHATQRFPHRVVEGRDFAQLEVEHERNADRPSAAFADIYFKKHLAFFKQAPKAYWVIWPNEPQVSYQLLPDLNGYWARMAHLFHENDLLLAGPALSAETRMWEPDPNDPTHKPKIEYMRPAMRLFKQYGFLFDIHGYYPYLSDPAAEDYLFPHRKIAKVLGADMPNVIYGEFGADANKVNNLIYCGWRDVPGLDYESYIHQLGQADAELAADLLVVGACVYLWCKTTSAEPDKAAYDISSAGRHEDFSVSEGLVQYIWTHPGADYIPVAQPPIEVPPPAPEPPPVTPPTPPYEATVTIDGLNLRDGSLDSSRLIKSLPAGASVTVLGDGRRVNVRVVIEGTVLKSGLTPK